MSSFIARTTAAVSDSFGGHSRITRAMLSTVSSAQSRTIDSLVGK